MAINRKGMRKIVIDNGTYYYKIYRASEWYMNYLRVTIEHPDGKITVHKVDQGTYVPFTPKDVAKLIRGVSEAA